MTPNVHHLTLCPSPFSSFTEGFTHTHTHPFCCLNYRWQSCCVYELFFFHIQLSYPFLRGLPWVPGLPRPWPRHSPSQCPLCPSSNQIKMSSLCKFIASSFCFFWGPAVPWEVWHKPMCSLMDPWLPLCLAVCTAAEYADYCLSVCFSVFCPTCHQSWAADGILYANCFIIIFILQVPFLTAQTIKLCKNSSMIQLN